jgi:uncharacterized protein (TIGR04255 family)
MQASFRSEAPFACYERAGHLDDRMTPPLQPMPRFDAPPVVETVMGVHFQPLPSFSVASRVLFWSTLSDQFPNVEEKAPVDEVREEFGVDRLPVGHGIRWQFSEALPSPRLWAKSPDGKHTIQLQKDALMVNWERVGGSPGDYWPYEERRREFQEKLERLDQFLAENQIGRVTPTSCFVTYINHVECVGGSFAPYLQRLLTVWSNDTSDDWLPPIERASLQLAFAMPEEQGRLHVSVAPGVRRTDKATIVRLDLTARGAPREPSLDMAMDWIDMGHEWIVRGFTSLTRPEMHQLWRRIQ